MRVVVPVVCGVGEIERLRSGLCKKGRMGENAQVLTCACVCVCMCVCVCVCLCVCVYVCVCAGRVKRRKLTVSCGWPSIHVLVHCCGPSRWQAQLPVGVMGVRRGATATAIAGACMHGTAWQGGGRGRVGQEDRQGVP